MGHLSQAKIDMRCSMNRSHVKANVPATLFVAVDVNSAGGPGYPLGSERSPLNIALAIDCSGSMQTEKKFEYAQQAAISLVRSLRPTDTVSVVSFETKARVEVPLIPATDLYGIETSIAATLGLSTVLKH